MQKFMSLNLLRKVENERYLLGVFLKTEQKLWAWEFAEEPPRKITVRNTIESH